MGEQACIIRTGSWNGVARYICMGDKPRGGQGREGPGDLCQTHEPIRLTQLARNGARALPKPDEVCPAVVGEDAECMLWRGDGGDCRRAYGPETATTQVRNSASEIRECELVYTPESDSYN